MLPDAGPVTGALLLVLTLTALTLTILAMVAPPRIEGIVAELAALFSAAAISAIIVVLMLGSGSTP